GFNQEMARQKAMGKAARKGPAGATDEERRAAYRGLLDDHGPDRFTGYDETESSATILAGLGAPAVEGRPDDLVEVFLDRTPVFAEAGGQVGDTGTITTATGSLELPDTTYALPGLHRHLARAAEGDVAPGQEATASVDSARRDAIRRNHTGTHLLHWALREVLGPHVKQAGSLVAPDRLRFDFSHYAAVTPEE